MIHNKYSETYVGNMSKVDDYERVHKVDHITEAVFKGKTAFNQFKLNVQL